ncbi:MAG: hypothetical protein HZA61_04405 [Candidatus Eisenbacteria bacterium]|uniref:DUF1850 domain-containing protein n=1 Tax=Eiseniibacteriota bacterium TaxID=2212470 RepID=A0A933SAT6_UNCEI|nr:hypothetical protein [Candidatus Eisenbacteria bacterium]
MHAPSLARRLTVHAALFAVFAPAAAHAILVGVPKPDGLLALMSRDADTIVVADVVRSTGVEVSDSSAFSRDGLLVMTRHTLLVRESWKGDARSGDTLEVWTPGGHVPGRGGMWIEDTAQLFPDRRYVLFLARWRGRLGVREGEMGALEVTGGRASGYVTEGRRELSWLRNHVKAAIAAP